MDVREIDGASYTGVDDVRKLQESLPYRPARDRFKIFIIDEVHMLSQNAWNAFLKTLEEPPAHVKFIFATTEVHKVPVTILSRVQRFDFKLIPTRLIAERLRTVLTSEGINFDEMALSIIAREAAGSMRDAMSLLDQVIAWRPDGLEGESVALVLGVASRRVLHDLGRALVNHDVQTCLTLVNQLANEGYDLSHVARDFLGLLRDLVVAKACEQPTALLDLPDTEVNDVLTLAQDANLDDLTRLHQGFSDGYDDVVRSGQPRSALEMLLVRLSRRPPLLPLDELLNRLGSLEHRFLTAAQRGNFVRPASTPRPVQAERAVTSGPAHADVHVKQRHPLLAALPIEIPIATRTRRLAKSFRMTPRQIFPLTWMQRPISRCCSLGSRLLTPSHCVGRKLRRFSSTQCHCKSKS